MAPIAKALINVRLDMDKAHQKPGDFESNDHQKTGRSVFHSKPFGTHPVPKTHTSQPDSFAAISTIRSLKSMKTGFSIGPARVTPPVGCTFIGNAPVAAAVR